MDFREDGKKRVENRRENEWEGCLVERGRGREKWWGPQVFSSPPSKYNLSKLERKLGTIFGQNCPTSFNVSSLLFFFFFLTFPFFGNIGFLFLFLFFFVFSFFGLRVVMGWGKAEGWGLCPSPAWFCLTPCLPRPA